MSVCNVLLNLLNELWKKITRGYVEHLTRFIQRV